jgi:hypothetical protein
MLLLRPQGGRCPGGRRRPFDQGRLDPRRRRNVSPFVRLPQIRIEHHCAERLRDVS